MNLKQLEALVWVARVGGFSAAAARLNQTQPAISLRIRELEHELGEALFDRTKRSVRLTPKGRAAVAYAERILAEAEDMHVTVAAKHRLAGHANIGVGESIAMTWLAQLLTRLGEDYPELSVDVSIDLTLPLWRAFDAGQFDAVLVGSATTPSHVPVEYLGALEFSWVAKPESMTATQPCTPVDLQSKIILTLSKNAAVYNVIDDWFHKGGAYPRRRTLCNSMMTLATLTMNGLGVSLLPKQLFRREIEEGKLAVVPTTPPMPIIHFHAAYRPGRWSRFGEVIAKHAQEVSDFPRLP